MSETNNDDISGALQRRNLELSVLSDLVNIVKLTDPIEDISSFIFDTINILGIKKSAFLKYNNINQELSVLYSFNIDDKDIKRENFLSNEMTLLSLAQNNSNKLFNFSENELDFFSDSSNSGGIYNFVAAFNDSYDNAYYIVLKSYKQDFFVNKSNRSVFEIISKYIYYHIKNLSLADEVRNMKELYHKHFYKLWFEKVAQNKRFYEKYRVPFTVVNIRLHLKSYDNFFDVADNFIDYIDGLFKYLKNNIKTIDFIIKTKFNQISILLPGVMSENSSSIIRKYQKINSDYKNSDVNDLYSNIQTEVFSQTYPVDTRVSVELIEKNIQQKN